MREFCEKCGVKLISIKNGFNDDGTVRYRKECPINVCGHTGIYHPGEKVIFQHWWDRWIMGMAKISCSVCGADKGWRVL